MDPETLGDRIAAWRKMRGLSQRQLAAAIGVSPSAVCMWEGKSKESHLPSTPNLNKVVALFGITMEKFYGPVPRPKKAKSA